MNDKKSVCYINAMLNKCSDDFFTLSLLGKPVIFYPIQAALNAEVFDSIVLLSDSDYISYIVEKQFADKVKIKRHKNKLKNISKVFELSGTAVLISSNTIKNVFWNLSEEGTLVSATRYIVPEYSSFYNVILKNKKQFSGTFISYVPKSNCKDKLRNTNVKYYMLSDTEALTINTKNDFELALVLKNKKDGVPILKRAILTRIEEKKEVFLMQHESKTICMIGHSQLDNWKIKSLCGLPIINCGIRGISSIEYSEYILNRNLLKCYSDIYLVMHGTNDFIYGLSDEKILRYILETFRYIRKNKPNAKIFFIKCIHVNGRLDRKNKRINEFNSFFEANLPKDIIQINVQKLDDEFGNLRSEYTIDGLHLNVNGYDILQEIVENAIYRENDNEKNSNHTSKIWF